MVPIAPETGQERGEGSDELGRIHFETLAHMKSMHML